MRTPEDEKHNSVLASLDLVPTNVSLTFVGEEGRSHETEKRILMLPKGTVFRRAEGTVQFLKGKFYEYV